MLQRLNLSLLVCLTLLIGVLTQGCDKEKPVHSGLQAAKRKWEKKGSEDYSYRFQIKDLYGLNLDATVVVEDGAIKEVLNPILEGPAVMKGDSIPALERIPGDFRTIDEWFDYIEVQFEEDAAHIGFDREFGYPHAVIPSKPGNDAITFYCFADYQPE